MDAYRVIEDTILAHAGAWWTYAITGLLCWVDGFFPPLPSESVVIAMAALSDARGGDVLLWALVLVACAGAWAGDNTAYWIGRAVPVGRLLRGERAARMMARSHDVLTTRGPVVLLSARFIPGYRIVVNMMAGHVGMPWRRFATIDAISTAMWCAFCLTIGVAAGSAFHDRPLLGILAGVALGVGLGAVIQRGATWWQARASRRGTTQDPSAG